MRYSGMFAPSARPDPVSVSTYATNGVQRIRQSRARNFHSRLLSPSVLSELPHPVGPDDGLVDAIAVGVDGHGSQRHKPSIWVPHQRKPIGSDPPWDHTLPGLTVVVGDFDGQ